MTAATDEALLALIETIADAGGPALSNTAFAERVGMGLTKDGVMHGMRRLAERGLVKTDVVRGRRRIYACRIGKWTDFNALACRAGNWMASKDDIALTRTNREPCVMCGIRADIGCRHSRA